MSVVYQDAEQVRRRVMVAKIYNKEVIPMAQIKFEETLEKLEKIVEELQAGNIPLDKAIKKYQEGIESSRQCFVLLDKAEKEVSICLKDKNGKIKIEPFKTGKDS